MLQIGPNIEFAKVLRTCLIFHLPCFRNPFLSSQLREDAIPEKQINIFNFFKVTL